MLSIALLHDPAILLLGINPREIRAYTCTTTFTRMFMAALFITVQKKILYNPNVPQLMNG